MKTRKVLTIIFGCVLAYAALVSAAQAETWNQMTKLTFSQPVRIPGQVLPAGSYWFVLQHDDADREIVQIFSADRSRLCTTLFTAPTERPAATNDTEVELAERPDNQPAALLKWYYPGLRTGHEFLYSSRREKEFARDTRQDVVAKPGL